MVYGLMAEYEIRISGVHYAANGDSVAGQKDTEEMHMRTRELLSRIDRVRPAGSWLCRRLCRLRQRPYRCLCQSC